MLCDLHQIGNTWICKRCGRKVPFNYAQKYAPTASCRVPEVYSTQYVDNVKIEGVGDTLSKIIKRLGFSYEPISQARSKITYINKRGIEWCSNHQEIIVDWMMEEAPKNTYSRKAFRSIVRLAIKEARSQTTK